MSWQSSDETLELEDAQGGQDLRGGQPRPGDQLVNSDGVTVELSQERSLLVAEGDLGGVADGGFIGRGVDFTYERAQLFEDVVDRHDQLGAVADQAMAAAASWCFPLREAIRPNRSGTCSYGTFPDDLESDLAFDRTLINRRSILFSVSIVTPSGRSFIS